MSDDFHTRQFLNEDEGLAAIEVRVTSRPPGSKDDPLGPAFADLDADVSISDCTRRIDLDFSVFARSAEAFEADYARYTEKWDRLLATLQAARAEYDARAEAIREAFAALPEEIGPNAFDNL